MSKGYPSDLAEPEWTVLTRLLPEPKSGGRPRITDRRKTINAIVSVLRSGCQWRMIPNDFPPYQTVYDYFRSWRQCGVWERIHDTLRGDVREAAGRKRLPSAGIIDSQTAKTTEQGGIRGYDGGKRTCGQKRHLVVDVLGLLLVVGVHSAGIQDRDGAKPVLKTLLARVSGLKLIWADGAMPASWLNGSPPPSNESSQSSGDLGKPKALSSCNGVGLSRGPWAGSIARDG